MAPLRTAVESPDILLDRRSTEPLHTQITRQLTAAIREGELSPARRLPSTRKFARLLGVSRNTVLVAYETLAAQDLVYGVHGSGTRVRAFAPVTLPQIADLLTAAMYPERVTLFSDPDGNPLYVRHPRRH